MSTEYISRPPLKRRATRLGCFYFRYTRKTQPLLWPNYCSAFYISQSDIRTPTFLDFIACRGLSVIGADQLDHLVREYSRLPRLPVGFQSVKIPR